MSFYIKDIWYIIHQMPIKTTTCSAIPQANWSPLALVIIGDIYVSAQHKYDYWEAISGHIHFGVVATPTIKAVACNCLFLQQ